MLRHVYVISNNIDKITFVHSELKITRDYFDATVANWNISAQSRPPASLCIKTGSQIEGWVSSSLDHVIRGGPKYTISLPSGRAMSVD